MQTVPRAEMRALLRFFSHIAHMPPTSLTIHSDSLVVVLGIAKGWYKTSHSDLHDAWRPIFEQYQQLHNAGWSLTVQKVKGHITDHEVENGEWRSCDQLGNNRADELAKLGAQLNEVSFRDACMLERVDSRAWLMQERLLAIVKNRIKLNPTPRRNIVYDESSGKAAITTLNTQLQQLSHKLIQIGHRTLCGCCQQVWHSSTKREIIEQGQCPGPQVWGPGIQVNPDIPSRLDADHYPVFGRRRLHASHALSYLKGFVFCRKCGCHTTSQRVAKLAEPCRMKPVGPTGRRQLTRMLSGQHPIGDWHIWPGLPAIPQDLAPYLVHE